jgi:CheY-like chemotaxis protein
MNSKHRILIVDDEVVLTRILKLTLEKTGKYDVRTENNPLMAFDAMHEFQPDVVVLDIIMPELTGPHLAEKLRNDPLLHKIPIIFLSGCPPGQVPGYPFLPKPSTLEELVKCIDEQLK